MKPKTAKAPPAPAPEPPAGLCPRAQELWRELVPRRAASFERQALLRIALEAMSRAEEVAEAIKVEGMTTTTKTTGAIHLNPLMKVERENRALFARIWAQLHFEWWAPVDGQMAGDEY